MKHIENHSENPSQVDRVHGAGSVPHEHRASRDADARLLAVALGLIVAFMAAEAAVGLLGRSVVLLADAGHMLADAAALGAALWAARLARRPATQTMTYGFHRAEVLSGALNGLTLLVVSVAVLAGAIGRLIHPARVDGLVLVVVAAAGIVVNVAASALVARADRRRIDVAGALAHLVTDVWAFAGTFVAGVVILGTGWDQADPVASLVVVALMGRAAWPLLRRTGRVLLEGTPEGVDLEAVRAHLMALPGVRTVHDLHAWTVTSDLPAVSAHVVVAEDCFSGGRAPRLLDQLQNCLAGHFDVEHSTFQLEADGHADHEPGRHD
jgi:cobalt-zinc-cadmium efflux system protein